MFTKLQFLRLLCIFLNTSLYTCISMLNLNPLLAPVLVQSGGGVRERGCGGGGGGHGFNNLESTCI